MSDEVECNLCGRRVERHACYVVRMDVFAHPSVPPITSEQLGGTDFDQTLDMLMDEMKHMSADELQDTVHRRFEYHLCFPCQRKFLANPLGKPRSERAGQN